MSEDWPSPHQHEPHPLPRVEDLPVAWEGYDRERVQAAFDAFYRHIAQLDSTLRTLEAVEVFRGQAGELRAELRSMRSAGWAPYPRGYTLTPERSMLGSVPDAVPRIALEVIFLVVVAAVVAVAEFSPLEIVAVMARRGAARPARRAARGARAPRLDADSGGGGGRRAAGAAGACEAGSGACSAAGRRPRAGCESADDRRAVARPGPGRARRGRACRR